MTSLGAAPAPSWGEAQFRETLGSFCSGVTVIAALTTSGPVGLTCQSFFSLSLDPPLIAFSVARTSTSYPAIREVGRCAISVLASHQRSVSDAFARSGTDKWAGVLWSKGPSTGQPLIDGSLAWLECEIDREHDAGDHVLAIARVRDLRHHAGAKPLLYFRGLYHEVRRDLA